MNLKRFFGKLKKGRDIVGLKARISYSQCGEDIIINNLFNEFTPPTKTFLDIGSNDPVICNNTYLLYQQGWRGVLVEPNPILCKLAKEKRPGDTIINAGIGFKATDKASFYLFPGHANTWSTFSEEESRIRQEASGIKPELITVNMLTINEIIQDYFKSCPDFVSVDVEGLDMDILQSLDFERFRPAAICVETVDFSISGSANKRSDISNFISSHNYEIYADTHINTIFRDKTLIAINT